MKLNKNKNCPIKIDHQRSLSLFRRIEFFGKKKNRYRELRNLYPFYSSSDVKFRLVRDELLTKDEYVKIMTAMMAEERFNKETKVDLDNYKSKWRIDKELLDHCKKNILIMHPGPMNEELEISHNVAHSDISLINKQVENGVFVRQSIMQDIFEGED